MLFTEVLLTQNRLVHVLPHFDNLNMLCHVKNNRNIAIIVVDYPLCKMDFILFFFFRDTTLKRFGSH